MVGSYHLSLELLSLLIGSLIAYQAIDATGRIAASRLPVHRWIWYGVGGWMIGAGLWSVHFVGMLAWLPQEVGAFDPALSVASGLAALAVGLGLLRVADCPSLGHARWLAGSLALGVGVAFIHMFSEGAMHVAGGTRYQPKVWLWWVLLCTFGVASGLRLMHAFRSRARRRRWGLRALLSVAMGALICVLLELSTRLSHGGDTVLPAETSPGALWLGSVVSLAAVLSMGAALALSELVVRLYVRTQRLSGSLDQLNNQLHHLATHDPLTGLPNRHLLAERMERALARARAGHGHLAVLYIDLDGFKTINDTLGHSFGDELLRGVAERLAGVLHVDSLARMSGDEFVAVLEHMRGPDSALRIARQLIGLMEESFAVRGTELRVTPSIGVAFYPRDGESVEDLVAHADAAMYEAKDGGRNGYRCYDASMRERAVRVLTIQRGLQTAVEDGSLSLHFQPKHCGNTGALVGAEALLRWCHPELGTVSPLEFITVAERSGQIARLGEWVIREACRQLREWHDRGLSTVRIAINLSPLQIQQPGLVDVAAGIVGAAGLNTSQIMFEVTESMAMRDAERTTAILRDFRAHGFEFAIDDFGTGYSSLAYLQKFQVRQLKIDQFFVQALDEGGHEPRAIIAAIIELAHTLGMEVVAEGVETAGQAHVLRELGCDQVQGYLLARPMPAVEFERQCLAGAAA
ncbi:MAG TPA: EAL domain-containing protein [Frateuria sp.]|uniref:putative bifunctional diguanylate cyclase/phosphodiesterase n=1 Tax=Frateuria sp. TaxID=2211372 RepID=UPI002DEB23FC|nr:EAL domain-containing protein [Frateuria sp.]